MEGSGVRHSLSNIPKIKGRIGFLKSFLNDGYDRAILVGEGVSRVQINGGSVKMLMESQTAWSRDSAVYGITDISETLEFGENEIDLDAQHLSSIRRFDLYLFKEEDQIKNWKTKSFVNGHCLGRYWNIGPQEEYKIPVSLLAAQNEIVVFDEEGLNPDHVVVQFYLPK